MRIIIFILLIVTLLFTQENYSEYYLKLYNNSYIQNGKEFNDSYKLLDSNNKYRFNTSNIDFLYRFSPKIQSRVLLSYIDVKQESKTGTLSRNGISDIWFEGHYYFSQYPEKQYLGLGLKIPTAYDEKKEPWLANGAYELRLKFLRKEKFSDNWDYELDFTFDYSITSSDRINSAGMTVPYYIAFSYYSDNFTIVPTLTGAFKSYEYGVTGNYGEKYNQFDFEAGLTVKYKLNLELELEMAYKRTITAFQTAQANTFGIGVAFGIRD